MPGPVATVGSMHTCPMVTGTTPHVGGPITGPGAPNVLHNGKPAAVVGDLCTCVGPPDMLVQGHPSILHNGKPAVCQNDPTAHGGLVSQGEPNIIHGFVSEPMEPYTMLLKEIPFPKLPVFNRLIGNAKEAIANQNQLKEQAEKQEEAPRVFNVQWMDTEKIVRNFHVFYKVGITAEVYNISDGESITFKVKKPTLPEADTNSTPDASKSNADTSSDQQNNEDHTATQTEEEMIEITGTVQDRRVEVTWEIADEDQPDHADQAM